MNILITGKQCNFQNNEKTIEHSDHWKNNETTMRLDGILLVL